LALGGESVGIDQLSTIQNRLAVKKHNVKEYLKSVTKIPADWTKTKFAKIYAGKICSAPKHNYPENTQEVLWRHLVVRAVVDKTKLRKVYCIPKKHLQIPGTQAVYT